MGIAQEARIEIALGKIERRLEALEDLLSPKMVKKTRPHHTNKYTLNLNAVCGNCLLSVSKNDRFCRGCGKEFGE